jgi:hypothetical protein
MQESGGGVTRRGERIVTVVPFKPSGLSAPFSHVDYEQLCLYIYQGFAHNRGICFLKWAQGPIFTQDEVNNVTPFNIL